MRWFFTVTSYHFNPRSREGSDWRTAETSL